MLPQVSFASSISTQQVNWKQRLRRAVGSPLGELLFTTASVAEAISPGWYTGIAAEPEEFSRQLLDLDSSIVLENQQAEFSRVRSRP